jgi:glycosyltransferase involved in cell wall biosynthesis
MRVAILTPDYLPDIIGGAGVSCGLLAEHLRRAGIAVDVFAFTSDGPGQEHTCAVPGGADHYLRRPGSVLALNLAAARRLRPCVGDYTIIHTYDAVLMPAGRLLARRRGPPVVATLNNLRAACFTPELSLKEECYRHGWCKSLRCIFANPEPSSRLRGLCYVHPAFHFANRLSRGLSGYIALTDDVKRHYVGAGFPEARISVVPNMLDEAAFPVSAHLDDAEGPPVEPRVILCVGQLDHRKGVLDLIEAYARLPADVRQGTRLTFLGRGKEEPAMRAAVARHWLSDLVEIRHCAYGRLPDEYRRGHIAVAPARWPEPFGRTRLEALAMGVPVLSSDTASAREVLGDNALYHRPFDVADLAEKLGQLLRDGALRRRVTVGARERLAAYRPGSVVPRIVEVYERAMSRA